MKGTHFFIQQFLVWQSDVSGFHGLSFYWKHKEINAAWMIKGWKKCQRSIQSESMFFIFLWISRFGTGMSFLSFELLFEHHCLWTTRLVHYMYVAFMGFCSSPLVCLQPFLNSPLFSPLWPLMEHCLCIIHNFLNFEREDRWSRSNLKLCL